MPLQNSNFVPRSKYRWCLPDVGFFAMLSVEPPIFYIVYLENLEFLLHALRDKPVDYLLNFYWCLNKDTFPQLSRDFAFWAKQYPLARIHCLANSPADADLLKTLGCPVAFCSQNAMVDEQLWRPDGTVPPQFDAMHDAQLSPYKRHELAVEVPSLAVISSCFKPKFDPVYAIGIAESLKTARWFNHPLYPDYRFLKSIEVASAYRQCRVGLCLSGEEGACYASIQYLLTGLPIVSTPSLGGRDVFFNSQNSLIVEPTPSDVRDAVAAWIERDSAPEAIRAATLPIVYEHRRIFVKLVNQILTDRNSTANFEAEWQKTFFDKNLVFKKYDIAIRSVLLGKNLILDATSEVSPRDSTIPLTGPAIV